MSFNQVDGLHQQIVIEVLVDLQQKVQTHFAKRKGNDQSGDVENEVFEVFSFLFNLCVVKRKKLWSTMIIYEISFTVSHFFRVDELLSLSSNVMDCGGLFFV